MKCNKLLLIRLTKPLTTKNLPTISLILKLLV